MNFSLSIGTHFAATASESIIQKYMIKNLLFGPMFLWDKMYSDKTNVFIELFLVNPTSPLIPNSYVNQGLVSYPPITRLPYFLQYQMPHSAHLICFQHLRTLHASWIAIPRVHSFDIQGSSQCFSHGSHPRNAISTHLFLSGHT